MTAYGRPSLISWKGFLQNDVTEIGSKDTLECSPDARAFSYLCGAQIVVLLLLLFCQATKQKLVSHVIADHSAIDPTFVEDLLLTYKTFWDRSTEICSQLLNWFLERRFRDKVSPLVSVSFSISTVDVKSWFSLLLFSCMTPIFRGWIVLIMR